MSFDPPYKDKEVDKGTAYVFPGQGSQAVGMGLEIYQSSRSARDVFEEADDALGFSLSKLIFEGPEEDLLDTVNSQPAIMTASIACLEAYKELGGGAVRPYLVAGHSLGEYTSLVVSGSLKFPDAVRLVRKRGEFMSKASTERPGGMAAIFGLNELALESVCEEAGVEVANVNSDDQVVVSGSKISIARVLDLASARGAKKGIPLSVSGAFHSSFMYGAKEKLLEAVFELDIKDATIPIVANSSAEPLIKATDIREELIEGLCKCVQWKRSVRYMVEKGVSSFFEFGQGRVLSGLIKSVERKVSVVSISDSSSARKAAELGK